MAVAPKRDSTDAAQSRLVPALMELAERLPVGVVVLDAHGRILFANRAAWALTGAGLVSAAESVPASDGPDARLRRLVHIALSSVVPAQASEEGVVTLHRPPPNPPVDIVIAAAPCTGDATMLLIGERRQWPQLDPEAVRRVYDLTRIEARLAVTLAGAGTLADYATHAGITAQTARSYLKGIFRKTGVHRQAELVALLLCGPAGFTRPPA